MSDERATLLALVVGGLGVLAAWLSVLRPRRRVADEVDDGLDRRISALEGTLLSVQHDLRMLDQELQSTKADVLALRARLAGRNH